jgi:hypothetical protein
MKKIILLLVLAFSVLSLSIPIEPTKALGPKVSVTKALGPKVSSAKG